MIATRHQHEPPRGDDIRQRPQRPRHALDRKNESRKEHRGQHRGQHGSQHGNALRGCAGRHEDPERQGHQDEQEAFAQQQYEAPAQRHAEHQPRFQNHAEHADEADGQVRRHLADDDLPRSQRRHEKGFHRAGLLLARDRNRRHQRRDDGQHECDQTGHKEIRARLRRIEAHARHGHDPYAGGPEPLLARIAAHHGRRIRLGRRRGIRLGRVGDDLHLDAQPLGEAFAERRLKGHRHLHVAAPEPLVERRGVGEHRHEAKQIGRLEPLPDFTRRRVGRRVDDGEPEAVDVRADRESEQHHLDDGHEHQDGERPPVAADVVRLLSQERPQRTAAEPRRGSHPAFSPVCASGRASCTNRSSIDATPNSRRRSAGAPIAPIRPVTMIEIRSQYSASSM